MNLNSKTYIVGHRGLVGSALIRRLSLPSPASGRGAGGEGPFSNLLTRTHAELDLINQAALEAFFAEEKPDYVFLPAAKGGGILANNECPAEFIRDNLAIQTNIIHTNIIHTAYKNNVKRLLFLGSSCIYPKLCPQPMKEEYRLTGPLQASYRSDMPKTMINQNHSAAENKQ